MHRQGNEWMGIEAKTVFENIGRDPVVLSAKEGLSLINGTSQMAAYLAEAAAYADRLCVAADAACNEYRSDSGFSQAIRSQNT